MLTKLLKGHLIRVKAPDTKNCVKMFYLKQKAPKTTVKKFQEQHQIDLVDTRSMHVEYHGKLFRYILSLMEVFSRFHWLVPLETKRSKCVKKELTRIYAFQGIPECLQSDNGGESKKGVERFCIKSKINMLSCRSYKPKAQGKVERSHRVLRQKIHSDLMMLG